MALASINKSQKGKAASVCPQWTNSQARWRNSLALALALTGGKRKQNFNIQRQEQLLSLRYISASEIVGGKALIL